MSGKKTIVIEPRGGNENWTERKGRKAVSDFQDALAQLWDWEPETGMQDLGITDEQYKKIMSYKYGE